MFTIYYETTVVILCLLLYEMQMTLRWMSAFREYVKDNGMTTKEGESLLQLCGSGVLCIEVNHLHCYFICREIDTFFPKPAINHDCPIY